MSKTVTVNVVNKSGNALPEYAHKGDAGVDLRADLTNITDVSKYFDGCAYDEIRNCVLMFPGGRCLIPTNLFVEIPEGYELQIRPRSGLMLKQGILAHLGTIDCGYRNSVGVILFNTSMNTFEIEQGDRIAQAVLNKIETIKWNEVESLNDSNRSTNGFGSSGIK